MPASNHASGRQQALRIARELDNPSMQADMWLRLGHALLELNSVEEAAEVYTNSLALTRELG